MIAFFYLVTILSKLFIVNNLRVLFFKGGYGDSQRGVKSFIGHSAGIAGHSLEVAFSDSFALFSRAMAFKCVDGSWYRFSGGRWER